LDIVRSESAGISADEYRNARSVNVARIMYSTGSSRNNMNRLSIA